MLKKDLCVLLKNDHALEHPDTDHQIGDSSTSNAVSTCWLKTCAENQLLARGGRRNEDHPKSIHINNLQYVESKRFRLTKTVKALQPGERVLVRNGLFHDC